MNIQTTGRRAKKILGLFEDDFETAVVDLVREVAGIEPKTGTKETTKFSAGSIDFKKDKAQTEQIQKQHKEENRKKDFFRSLEISREQIHRENDRLFEEEINDIATNLPTEQKNQLLGYQASYRDKSIYQRAELRKKLIEQRRQSEKQEKAASATQAKAGFGENELLMGGERSGGGHWTTAPG